MYFIYLFTHSYTSYYQSNRCGWRLSFTAFVYLHVKSRTQDHQSSCTFSDDRPLLVGGNCVCARQEWRAWHFQLHHRDGKLTQSVLSGFLWGLLETVQPCGKQKNKASCRQIFIFAYGRVAWLNYESILSWAEIKAHLATGILNFETVTCSRSR